MKLDDIEKLIAAATPAPWEYIERDGGAINCVDVWRSGRVTVERTQSDPVDRANAAFIAASRELVPRMVKALRTLEWIAEHSIIEWGRWTEAVMKSKEALAELEQP